MLTLFKVLADGTRLRLLRLLRQGDFTVQELTQILGMGQSRISRHLKLLTDAGLLRVEKQGTWHYYRLAPAEGLFGEIRPAVEARFAELEGQADDAAGVAAVMAERRRRSQAFFDRHARDWDHMHVELLKLPDYREQLLALLPQGGLQVEIGTGSGNLLPLLAGRGGRTVGIDHAPAMVALARETVTRHGLEGAVEVRLAEMNHLPFPVGAARAVVVNQVLHHAERPAEVLGEIARVLEPRGVLVLADLVRHQHDWTRERLADQWLGFGRDELQGWLDEAGLIMESYREFEGTDAGRRVLLLSAWPAGLAGNDRQGADR